MENNNVFTFDWELVLVKYRAFSSRFPSTPELPLYTGSIDKYLDCLSLKALDINFCPVILYCFKDIYFEIIARTLNNFEKLEAEFSENSDQSIGIYCLNSIAYVISLINEDTFSSLIVLIENFIKKIIQDLEFLKHEEDINLVLLSLLRLLNYSKYFGQFYSLTHLHIILNDSSISRVSKINKFFCVKIISKILNYSSKHQSKLLKQYNITDIVGILDNDPNFNYKFFDLYESKRISNIFSLPSDFEIPHSENIIKIPSSILSQNIKLIYDNLIPVDENFSNVDDMSTTSHFTKYDLLPIPSSIDTLNKLTKKILVGKPIIICGDNSSGKSLVINHLHRLIFNNANLVTIHLNDQTDLKLLLGTYISGEEPGKFVWKDGILTNAVKNGKWLIIEDIDNAKNEILSIFSSLIESNELIINGNEKIPIKNGFQIIATISNSNNNISRSKILLETSDQYIHWKDLLFSEDFLLTSYESEINANSLIPDLISLNKFEVIFHQSPNPNEILTILRLRYPNIAYSIWMKIIALFFYMRFKIFNKKSFISMNNGLSLKKIDNFELIRLANRVNLLNTTECDDVDNNIFFETIDIFTASLQNDNIKSYLVRKIGNFLEISASQIAFQLNNINGSSNFTPELKIFDDQIMIGRSKMIIEEINHSYHKNNRVLGNFALTNHSLRLLEKISISINLLEPLLLLGETGCGKTTIIQNLATLFNKKLIVLNLSQDTESNDLIGGYKPILNKFETLIIPLHNNFLTLFGQTFNLMKNQNFIGVIDKQFKSKHFSNVLKLWKKAIEMARGYIKTQKKKVEDSSLLEKQDESSIKKRRKLNNKVELANDWNLFEKDVLEFQVQFEKNSLNSTKDSLQFDFIEGSLVRAIKNGDWVLLDEINLASSETLENISDLLNNDPRDRKLLLTEKATDANEIVFANNEFRLFACMNPSTDVGKKNLPENIRSKFNEIFVDNPDKNRNDLRSIVHKYLWNYLTGDDFSNNEIIDDIVDLYYKVQELNNNNFLVDGAKNKIIVNIRILSRALVFTADIIKIYGIRRSLYESFNMILLTLLDASSEKILTPIIYQYTIGKLPNVKGVMNQIPPKPNSDAIKFHHYWLEKGEFDIIEQPNYIITPFVEKNLLNLVRATLTKRFPILIQGPTSSGKTSMINYVAKITGNKVIRINNHEYTDLQEYLGSYISDTKTGKLIFKHGPLIEALKKGYWIILDELNLASSEILEGINRLLDDNREIFLTETQELIRPHKNFLLFATQNPPGAVYGGRKFLSKAFRNRFLELSFDDIPQDELEIILFNRCKIAPSYAKRIVEVYKELNIQRSSNRIFETKNSFATLRDLFRWGNREAIGYEQLAINGYMLLAEKNRKVEEKYIIKKALEKVMRVQIDVDELYNSQFNEIKEKLMVNETEVVWTKEMKKLSILIIDALKNNENILLVGETGCGKTTVCSNLARFYYQKNMVFLNAHQNIETSDIIGSQRPVRSRNKVKAELHECIVQELNRNSIAFPKDADLNDLNDLYQANKEIFAPETIEAIENLLIKLAILFEWNDGPLISAMKTGDIFLFDEISLAEDSVLERLNSVLEPEKELYLTEYSNDIEANLIKAKAGFQFLATMNPGGDYGKKELSPALRNRFTEIYVPSMSDFDDITLIVESKLESGATRLTKHIIEFSKWFGCRFSTDKTTSNNGIISIRDILAWVDFINNSYKVIGLHASLVHGVCMVFVDSLGTNNTAYLAADIDRLNEIKVECIRKLSEFESIDFLKIYKQAAKVEITPSVLKIGDFSIPINSSSENESKKLSFNLQAPTSAMNAMRVLRGMVIKKPILLEGDPGVGKSSLIDALAKSTNNKLIRINLSDQTDLVDLFGSDAPVEGGNFGEFVWKDAPFLHAMKSGQWVLLDEMNLASPSLLEALNSVFDFRMTVYIPELDQEFECHPDFRVFAAQNPQFQGGGRKGLPKSFINRFSNVYIGKLNSTDMKLICEHIYPNVSRETIDNLVEFVFELEKEVNVKKAWGHTGGPWEFNIRDIIKFLNIENSSALDLVFIQKFRLQKDKDNIYSIYKKIFGSLPMKNTYYFSNDDYLQFNDARIQKIENTGFAQGNKLAPLQSNIEYLQSIIVSINKNFPVLLVGPTLGGKSDLINFVANSVGARLETVHIHNEVDITDLVGGLDQYHVNKELFPILQSLEYFLISLSSTVIDSKIIHSIYSFIQYLNTLKKSLNYTNFDDQDNINLVVEQLIENITSLKEKIINEDLDEFISSIIFLKSKRNKQFQFFDGILVDALEKGYWLHLSNINLVNSSIVDRLNSLTETNGVLVVNESSSLDGEPKVIRPHKDFRLFLSMNPKYGELSRAMRNRCVELYIDSFDARATEYDELVLGFSESLSLPQVSRIEQSLLNLSFEEKTLNKSRNAFSNIFSASNQFFTKYMLIISDILNFAFHHGYLKQEISVVLACFVTQEMYSLISEFCSFACESSIFSANEKEGLFILRKFLKFQHELGVSKLVLDDNENGSSSLIELLRDNNDICFSFSFAKAIFELFRFSEKLEIYIKLENNIESDKFIFVSQLFGFIKHALSITLYEDAIYDKFFILCIYCSDAIDTKEPEKINFIIEQSKELVEEIFNLTSIKASHSLNLDQLLNFSVQNSKSMTLVWNHFITLPETIANLSTVLPEAWKLFIVLETEAEKVIGVSLDLEKFKSINGIEIQTKGVFEREFADLLKLIEAYNTANFKINIDENFMMLSLRAGIPLVSLSDRYVGKLTKPYPLILKEVYQNQFLGSSALIGDIHKKTKMLDELPGAQIKSALNDIKYLTRELLRNSNILLTDQLVYFRDMLKYWLKEVLASQLTKYVSLINCIKDSWDSDDFVGFIKNFLEAVKAIPDLGYLYNIMTTQFFQAISIFSGNVDLNFENLGKSYIFFCIGLIELFIPSAPYDPAICEFVLFNVLNIKRNSSKDYLLAVELVRKVMSGDEKIYFEENIRKDDFKICKPRVYRPENSSMDSLFNEWCSFMGSSIGARVVERLYSSLDVDSPHNIVARVSMLHKNTERFLLNLRENFSDYNDLNIIFEGAILGINFGFSLTQMFSNRNDKTDALSSLTNYEDFFKSFNDVCINLECFGFFMSADYEVNKYFRSMNSSLINSFKNWKLSRTQKEKEFKESESIYKYNGISEDMDDLEDAYKQLFPEYDEDKETTEDESNEQLKRDYLSAITGPFISTTFCDVFLNRISRSITNIVDDVNSSSFSLYKEKTISSPSSIASIINNLWNVTFKRESQKLENTDFYFKPNYYQFSRCLSIIDDIKQEVSILLQEWSDNSTLVNIYQACSELYSYDSTTTIARLIVKVEQIHKFIDELILYSGNINKKVFQEFFEKITNLIISWRRLELGSFNNLIENEGRLIEQKLDESFYLLFELLVVGYANDGKNIEEVVSLLNIFLTNSTNGEFEGKLNLLKSFVVYLKIGFNRSSDMIENIIMYYEQFLPLVKSNIETVKERLTKEINEVILLASWKDVNIDALKSSSKKSKRALYKVIKKYRAVLTNSVTTVIESGLEFDLILNNALFNIESSQKIIPQINGFTLNNNLWKTQSKLISDLKVFIPKVTKLKSDLESEELPLLYEFSGEILNEMEKLKNATPREFNEENKKIINGLKSEKRILLSSTMKELKKMGLKTQEIQKYNLSVISLLSNSSSLRSVKDVNDKFYFKILDLLPRMKSSAVECVEDVPRDDIIKGMAVAEHLVFTLFSLRNPLACIHGDLKSLSKNVRNFEKIAFFSESNEVIIRRSSNMDLKQLALEKILKFFPSLLDFAIDTIQRSSKFETINSCSEICSPLLIFKAGLESFASRYYTSTVAVVYSSEKINFYEELESMVSDFIHELKILNDNYPNYKFIGVLLISWLNDAHTVHDELSDENFAEDSFEVILNKILDLGKSIAVSLQKIKKLQHEEVSVESDHYFMKTQQKYVNYAKFLYLENMNGKMTKIIESLTNVSVYNKSLVLCIDYFLPLILEYYNCALVIQRKFSENYVDVSKSTYLLTSVLYKLAKEGFCTPKGAPDENEQTEKGSGGGVGDDDVTEDAETNNDVDENDLDEDAFTQKNNDENNNDNDDNDDKQDNAMDIEGNMDGKTENLNAEDENDEDAEDLEDLDENIDELDELDPNAIDEKMWDEETNDKKEKQTDEIPDNSNSDANDIEAMEDDAKQDKNKTNENAGNEENCSETEEYESKEDENSEADDQEDIGQQEDEVVHDDKEQFENDAPEGEALELPEDLNLDDQDDDQNDKEDEENDDNFDSNENNQGDMDMDDKLDELPNIPDSERDEDENENENENETEINNDKNEAEESDDGSHGNEDVENSTADENLENDEDMDKNVEDEDTEMEDVDNKKNETNEDQGNDNKDDNAIDTVDSNAMDTEDIDNEASAKQATGEYQEGANDNANDADTATGHYGEAHSQMKDETIEKSKNEEKESEQNEKLKESLKQLGDSLENFYKRSEDILDSNEATDDQVNEDKHAENPEELQHLDDANHENYEQALGKADQDELMTINEEKEIKEEDVQNGMPNEENEESNMNSPDDIDDSAAIDGNPVKNDENIDGDFDEDTSEKNKAEVTKESSDMDIEIESDEESRIEENFEDDDEDENLANNSIIIDLEKVAIEHPEIVPPLSMDEATELWHKAELSTTDLSMVLSEQLRLILSPTVATKLKGDYKNGKRLNLKKIISYIASDFKKDKIWLKRTKPSKRNYQIMMAIDDSKSMSEDPQTVKLTYDTISLVSKALTQLEAGDLSIVKFGKETSIIHNFNKKFNSKTDGPNCFRWFGFDDTVTKMKDLIDNSIEIFNNSNVASSNTDLYKLEIIISDGIFESHDEISRLVRKAKEQNLLIVFVIINGLNQNNESISDMSQVKYEFDANGNMNMKIDKYLDTFPFENYIIVDNMNELPSMICQILKTFFMSSI